MSGYLRHVRFDSYVMVLPEIKNHTTIVKYYFLKTFIFE